MYGLATPLFRLLVFQKAYLQFSVSKCEVMHIGGGVLYFTYMLMASNQKQDLGIIVDNLTKTSTHCVAAMKKGKEC